MKKEVYGLLGERLVHSYSPEIHAALGDYEYRLFERTEQELPAFLASDEFTAINVTIPYKKAVIPYLAGLSPEAEKIGSVNTVTRTPLGLYGDNTDYYGFSYMLDAAGIAVGGRKCLILGSGGACATARAVVSDRGGEAVVISRHGENHYGNLSRHADAEVIVNTTPVGMYPNNGAAPLSLDGFPRLTGVVDMIYNPRRTALILDAETRGIPSVSGLSMLVAQAKRANELFFGRPLPDSVIPQVEEAVRRQKENVVLIGMPGAGKTTAGQALAAKLGFGFLDTDEEIERLCGRHPSRILTEDGEDAFRAVETEAIRRAGKRSGCVIATGGGAVTRAENYAPLHQNGTIVFLTRPLEELARGGRPLSAAFGVETLYAARLPLYETWADVRAVCLRDPAATADAILCALGRGANGGAE